MPESETGAVVAAQTVETQSPSFDRAALESKVAQSLAAAFDDELAEPSADTEKPAEPEKVTEPVKTEETEQPAEQEKPAETENAEKPEEATEEAAVEEAPKPSDTPILPDSYRRSLKNYGWQDEEINKNLGLLGNEFIKTAAQIHSTRNSETARMAEIGRQARQQQQEPTERKQAPVEPMKPLDASALKEHFGDDPVIEQVIGPINAVIERINAILPEVQGYRQSAQQAEMETLGKQVNGFFVGKELEPYQEAYGNMEAAQLTDEQVKARNKVLETADALMLGAKIQGRKLSLGEALQAAHDSVSGEFKEKAVRTTIKKQLTQRAKGITLKPSSNKPAESGRVATRSELEKRTAERLRAAFS